MRAGNNPEEEAMLTRFLDNFRQPRGIAGRLIAGMMNIGHGPMTRQVLDSLGMKQGDAALDIGCGGGAAIAEMAARGAIVYGIDHSPVSVRAALRKNRANVDKGVVHIRTANVDNLPFAENMFDWVTAFETIYFWNNIEDNFSGILRVLKPGGRFVIALEAYLENGKKIHSPAILDSLNLRLYSAETLRDMAGAAGYVECASFKGGNGWLCFSCRKPLQPEPGTSAP